MFTVSQFIGKSFAEIVRSWASFEESTLLILQVVSLYMEIVHYFQPIHVVYAAYNYPSDSLPF